MSLQILVKYQTFNKNYLQYDQEEYLVVIVCQHIAGLKVLYPDDIWQDLFGNCDIKIMMGTNDLLTAEYISELLGVSQ